MGKTIFAAVVAAVLASIATVLVMDSLREERAVATNEARKLADETARIERERLERRVADVEKRAAAAPRAERRPAESAPEAAPANGEAAPPPPLAPDGTPYVSRAELETFARTQGAALVREAMAAPAAVKVEKKTLEEIAREQGLSAGEEANIRNLLREAEEEMVRCIFGDKSMDEVQRLVLEAKDDPDKQAALTQTAVQNGIANLGKLMTAENRMKKKVENVLGAERAAKFLAAPRKPVIAPEFEAALKATFDGK
jgi:hypothetical protein